MKCARQYNRCYALGANWDRRGDPSLLPMPRKTATIVHGRHSLLRGRNRSRDRGAALLLRNTSSPLEFRVRVYSSMLTPACLGMHPDFETLATLLPLAASSQVRKPEIKNSIWNASLEIGMENGVNICMAPIGHRNKGLHDTIPILCFIVHKQSLV